jgi:hypothetical protein
MTMYTIDAALMSIIDELVAERKRRLRKARYTKYLNAF